MEPDNLNIEQPAPEKAHFRLRKNPFILGIFVALIALTCLAFLFYKPLMGPSNPKNNQNTGQNTTDGTDSTVPDNTNTTEDSFIKQSDLPEVTNIEDYYISSKALDLLKKNKFVVIPSNNAEFFSVYENNRYLLNPNFITTDSILHNYHLVFNYILKKLEMDQLATLIKDLNSEMLSSSISQYNSVKGTSWENAAKRNVAFFAVGTKLMDPNSTVPAFVQPLVNEELSLITKHEAIAESPIMNLGADVSDKVESPWGPLSLDALKEDYTQYVPRGHYDQNDTLKAYFKTMMWYGRMTFRLKSPDETKSAILLSLNLNNNNTFRKWNKMFETINFFVGKTDDINYLTIKELIESSFGSDLSAAKIAANTEGLNKFMLGAEKLDPPQINSIPIFDPSFQPDREKETKGFRYMGQRFTIDASIMQKLVYRDTDENSKGVKRYLPKGLDVAAAMGSEEALNILKDMGETDYKKYPENMHKLRDHIKTISKSVWTSNLYWNWMYTLNTLVTSIPSNAPEFMKNSAWLRKQLNTYLGSWTELKHDTILYAKQVYAEMGGGPPDEKDDRGYVEPNPELYSRLSYLIKLTNTELSKREMLNTPTKEILTKMQTLVDSLKTISDKELAGQTLTEADYELIRNYGGSIEHFWYEVNKEDMGDQSVGSYLEDNPSALVADVATDPNGFVLEEGTGHVYNIYAIVPVEGKLRIASGSVFSYYEFPWPMNDRLTDDKWRALINSEDTPSLPEWTKSFIHIEK